MIEQRESKTKDDGRAREAPSPGLVREFFRFLLRDSIWWLLAILIVLALVGLVIYFTADSPAPFIYRDAPPR